MTIDIRLGDCLDLLKSFPDNHFDACVTDPPYGLEFMGKEWDRLGITKASPIPRPGNIGGFADGNKPSFERVRRYLPEMQAWHQRWADEILRVLKPGAHLLAFGGTRTSHRLVCALEDAGFEIRDTVVWLYGSGFPKSLDVSKAIDRHLGAERPIVGKLTGRGANPRVDFRGGRFHAAANLPSADFSDITGPATDESAAWSGWGTALKPAYEPIILARKPLDGTVAENVLKWGVGGLNIDATRISGLAGDGNWGGTTAARIYDGGWDSTQKPNLVQNTLGRWPANVLLDEEAARQLDAQTGELKSGEGAFKRNSAMGYKGNAYGKESRAVGTPMLSYGDSGGASRFFYCAKADRDERERGLESLPIRERTTPLAGRGQPGLKCKKCGRWKVSGNPCVCPEPEFEPSSFDRPPTKNTHPTVKPMDLMRYLIRLVTPRGGTIVDPFAGNGTTLIAAQLEGFSAVGVEKESEYVEIARARIRGWFPLESSSETRTT